MKTANESQLSVLIKSLQAELSLKSDEIKKLRELVNAQDGYITHIVKFALPPSAEVWAMKNRLVELKKSLNI